MIKALLNYFHHLTNPHCEICEAEKKCKTCALAIDLLNQERAEKFRLLRLIAPEQRELPVEEIDYQQLQSRLPLKARLQKLERDSAKAAAEKIQDLEREAGIQ